ncbi:MAG: hypothetical protein K0S76_542 [Herbinix sp.]|jgi:DNA repair exonuclease SbcCD ATPase subunit|nr:hypothetical protein [Herbinix sp.]
MLFTKLKLNYFGRFHNREIDLKPGINIIYGENEAGKSTLHTFIKGMLFGIERLRGRGSASKEDIYTRYLPWDYPGAFGGSMDILLDDKQYRIQRSFHTNDKSFIILDLSTGRELKLKEGLLSEMIPGLTESAFRNTVSIEQLKAETDAELAAQVRNYITNLSIAKSKEVNVVKALTILNEKKKVLEASLNTPELKALQSEIEEGMAKEEKIDSLTLQLRDLMTEEQELKKQREAVLAPPDSEEVKRREELPAILEKYRSYLELLRHSEQLERQCIEFKEKMSSWEVEKLLSATLRKEIKEAEALNLSIRDYEIKQKERLKEQEVIRQADKKRNTLISMLPTGGISILSIILARPITLGFVFAAVALLIGGATYVFLERTGRVKQRRVEEEINSLMQKHSAAIDQLHNILSKNQSRSMEELRIRQEEFLKHSIALELNKKQLADLELRKEELEDNKDLLYDTIMKYTRSYLLTDELTVNSIQRLQEIIQQTKLEEVRKHSEINGLYENCRLRIEKLRWELSTMEGNELLLLKNKERYEELQQRQKESAVELEAVRLALNTIQSLSVDIHDSFGRQLNEAVSAMIGEVTGQKYTDIKVDEKLNVKVGWKGNYVLLDKLSAGTIDQVYFALRLAVADLLLGRDEIPLIFDDSFALYDDIRIKAALNKIKDRKQILMFSCHRRERLLLEDMGIPYHFVDLTQNA